MGLRCLYTSIFIKTPSLEGLPTKAKEDPSPHEMRLSPVGHQPSIFWSRGHYYYFYCCCCCCCCCCCYFSPYILLTDQISLSDCIYFLRYWEICVIFRYPVCDAINSEINLSFLVKTFSHMTRKLKKKSNILRTKKSYKIKSTLHHFVRASICQKLF